MSKTTQQMNAVTTKADNAQLPQPPNMDATSPLAPIPIPLPEIQANSAKRTKKDTDSSPKNITSTTPANTLIPPSNPNTITLQQQQGSVVIVPNGSIITTNAPPSGIPPNATVVVTTAAAIPTTVQSLTSPTGANTVANTAAAAVAISASPLNKKYSLGGGKWTQEEDEKLKEGVQSIGPKNWKRISQEFLGGHRSDIQCLHRWQKVLKPGLVKGRWSKEEDAIIIECIKNGMTKWSRIASYIPGRIGKQCRDRWYNQLHPQLVRADWTEEEDRILQEGHNQYGNKWTEIAKLLPGRSDNCVKNRWNSAIRKNKRKSMKQLERENNTPILSNLTASQIAANVSIANPNLIQTNPSNNGSANSSTAAAIQTPIPMVMEEQQQQQAVNSSTQQSSQQNVALKDDKQMDEVTNVRSNPYTGEHERPSKRAKIAQI